jgi:hypothetical protein
MAVHAMLAPLVVATLACAPPAEGPALLLPTAPSAIEARFGDDFCRRIEDRDQLDHLVAFSASIRTGWQAAWKQPPAPQLVVDYYDGERRSLRLGVGDGQLFTTLEERPHFRPLSESAASELIRSLGGPPTAAPAIRCLGASGR